MLRRHASSTSSQIRVRVPDLGADRVGRIEQAIHVAFELEVSTVGGAESLEHADAVEQGVVEDADRRIGGRRERAANVDETVVVRERAGGRSHRLRAL